ncbi:hypothetical protein [Sphingomonas elodea]|uniref:hypothetical protein n=1 Tax=Sphingomonas elodea TaxID=179878 RepID=UPI001300C62A|nr:hypothetical protein [Sphingomonas elodea]
MASIIDQRTTFNPELRIDFSERHAGDFKFSLTSRVIAGPRNARSRRLRDRR